VKLQELLVKSLCAVQNVYQRYEETGLITRRPGSGRKRVTTRRDDRFLVSTSLRNRHTAAPRTAQELRELLLQEWNNIDQNVILNLIQSMPRRLQTVINARGGNTRY
jgi:hypothetical protein